MKNVIKQCRSYYNIKKKKLKNKIAGSTIAKFKNFQITCRDVYDRLLGQQWLNDNIIDAFSAVIQEQSKHKIILSSYLLSKDINEGKIVEMNNWICKAIGRVNEHRSNFNGNLHDALKDVHSLMIPACFNQHWYLCVVNLKDNTATVIDGLNSDSELVTNNLLLKLLLTLQYYHENTERIPNFNLAKMKIYKTLIPIQQDYLNCGVIVLKTIYGLMKLPSII